MPADRHVALAAELTCARIGAFARDLPGHAPLPGGVIVLADRSATLGQVTFGHADLGRGEPMQVDHLFQIGSISKVFTALLAGQLAAESRLSLDEPVSRFLPWLDLGVGARPATLRSLLSHTAGLVIGSDAVPDDLAQIWRLRELAVDPGPAHFHYSNLGFQIAGLVLEAAAGEPLGQLVADRLLAPMGMTSSAPAITFADRPRFATGYIAARQDRIWLPGDPLVPAPWFELAAADGNIAATGPDLARLAMLLLDHGRVGQRQVVDESVVATMTASLAPDAGTGPDLPGVPPLTATRYGLGIGVDTIDGNLCLTHGGGMVGYSTFLLADTSAGLGVVVLTNADGGNAHAELIARAAHTDLLARLAGGPEPALPSGDPVVRLREMAQASPLPLGRFVAPYLPGRPTRIAVLGGPGGTVVVSCREREGRLFRLLTGTYATDHPDLRSFALTPAVQAGQPLWTWGPVVYREDGGDGASQDPGGAASQFAAERQVPELWTALEGHYRCYSPWYPEFRVFVRAGALWLAAPGGVEAPGAEEPLIEVTPGVFRIGAEDWLPERLTAGPLVDGRVISVNRDGCEYSRSFTP